MPPKYPLIREKSHVVLAPSTPDCGCYHCLDPCHYTSTTIVSGMIEYYTITVLSKTFKHTFHVTKVSPVDTKGTKLATFSFFRFTCFWNFVTFGFHPDVNCQILPDLIDCQLGHFIFVASCLIATLLPPIGDNFEERKSSYLNICRIICSKG